MLLSKWRAGVLHRQVRYLQTVLNWPFQSEIKISEKMKSLEESWSKKLMEHFENQKTIPCRLNEKKYILSMFPYPSGRLHIGHMRVYTISDATARYYRLNGYRVIHPIGWDSFGLPAENAARNNGVDPREWTIQNIETMRRQLKATQLRNVLVAKCPIFRQIQFDWNREISTCEPEFYRWTQWIFCRLFENGLVRRTQAEVNWDPIDQTVLAAEQIDNEGRSWRSGAVAEKKKLRKSTTNYTNCSQWMIETPKYAKRLQEGLRKMSEQWGEVADIQANWIGKCDVFRFMLPVIGTENEFIDLRIRDIFEISNAEFLVLKRAHPMADKTQEQFPYKLPFEVLNGVTGRRIPAIVVDDDYLPDTEFFLNTRIGNFKTDKELAEKFRVQEPKLKRVLTKNDIQEMAAVSSSQNFKKSIIDFCLQFGGYGGYETSRTLTDWVVSRQRAWGTPIPMIQTENGRRAAAKLEKLPVLGTDRGQKVDEKRFETAGTFDSDTLDTFFDSSWLVWERETTNYKKNWKKNLKIYNFKQTTRCRLQTTKKTEIGRGSIFESLQKARKNNIWTTKYKLQTTKILYYLRYLDPKNASKLADDVFLKEMPVDVYVGGIEHAAVHMFFARFVSYFLNDIGVIPTAEPFTDLIPQGIVRGRTFIEKSSGKYLSPDDVEYSDDQKSIRLKSNPTVEVESIYEKMSKSKNNGVDLVELLTTDGIDLTRLRILEAAAPRAPINWGETDLKGAKVYCTFRNYKKFDLKTKRKILDEGRSRTRDVRSVGKTLRQSATQHTVERRRERAYISCCRRYCPPGPVAEWRVRLPINQKVTGSIAPGVKTFFFFFANKFKKSKTGNCKIFHNFFQKLLDRIATMTSDVIKSRVASSEFKKDPNIDSQIKETYNFFVRNVGMCLEVLHLHNTALMRLQGFTNALKKIDPVYLANSEEGIRAVRSLIIMLQVFCPHVAAEMWTALEPDSGLILTQNWPEIDADADVEFLLMIDGVSGGRPSVGRQKIENLRLEDLWKRAELNEHSDILKMIKADGIVLKDHRFSARKGFHVTLACNTEGDKDENRKKIGKILDRIQAEKRKSDKKKKAKKAAK
ncbi:Protein CBR-LARS-2 [Caenorhabditis briggsae]|uniref:leucine--tRNA ligase n=1 Tax=Caenorhabditis briggsae TaxID=6238 RepID=A8XE78_CAEBR|nr:Protein CBR-LARS-2 [Caenorhabditis briggsae]CAP30950.2 Protein CBR-LARS-2 [Caenorhabditis briggsae]